MAASGDDSESGIMVYPQLPVPVQRRAEPSEPRRGEPRRKRPTDWRLISVAVFALAAGGTGAWLLRPMIAPDARIAASAARAHDAEAAAGAQKDRADGLEKSLETTAKARRDAEARLGGAEAAQAELAGKTAAEASQRQAAEAAQAKLKAAVDRSVGAVTIEGAEVHVRIADRIVWKPNDDALTDRGKLALARIAAVLKDLPDRVIWVQGHTDDQPVPLPRAPAAAPASPAVPAGPAGKKGARPAAVVVPPAPVVRFPTSWELSGARALSVVRYFQDVAKLEPARLTALAFGQYAPVSKTDRAANRRLEIVLAARHPPAK
jgi:chemotaxis protein MotB